MLLVVGLRTKLSAAFNAAWWRTHGDIDVAKRETRTLAELIASGKWRG